MAAVTSTNAEPSPRPDDAAAHAAPRKANCGPAAGSPARRRSRTPSAVVENELIAAAEAVLVRDGPGGLVVRAVAEEAGTSQMSVYNRFGGRSGLVNALLIIGFERLRAAIEIAASGHSADAAAGGTKPDMLSRLRESAQRYRGFALANPHFYAIMFEGAVPYEFDSPQVWERAKEATDVFIRLVEMAAIVGQIAAPDPTEVAQRIWSSVHGAVALELKGIMLTSDPSATYDAMLDTIFRGLAPRGIRRAGEKPSRG